MDLTPNTNWMPTKRKDETFPRKLISVERSHRGSGYDRVNFRRILQDGSVGALQTSYLSGWTSWVRKFGAKRDDARTAPPFPSAGGVQFYAKDGSDQWHYVNHAGTWQACPAPVA